MSDKFHLRYSYVCCTALSKRVPLLPSEGSMMLTFSLTLRPAQQQCIPLTGAIGIGTRARNQYPRKTDLARAHRAIEKDVR